MYPRTAKPHNTRAGSTRPALRAVVLVAPSAPMTKSACDHFTPSSATRPSSTDATRARDVDRARVERSAAQTTRRTDARVPRSHDLDSRGLPARAATPAVLLGPVTIMSPAVCAPSTLRPRSSSRRTPRGPIRSPHALSRPRPALSTSATRAPPWRASTRRRFQPDQPRRRSRRNLLSTMTPHWSPWAVSLTGASRWTSPDPEHNRTCSARRLFAPLAGRYDRLAEILSMGQNRRWRTAMVEHITGPALTDSAGSRARCCLRACSRHPGAGRGDRRATSIGLDLSETHAAPRRQQRRRRRRCRTASAWCSAEANSCRSPMPAFDALTFTYLLRYVADPAATLAELARVVKPGGRDRQPRVRRAHGAVVADAWWCYTRIVLPIAGLDHGRPCLVPTSDGSSARASRATTASTRVDWTVDAWQRRRHRARRNAPR